MVKTSVLATLVAASVSSVAAQFQIISPGGPELFWIAASENVLAWTCGEGNPAATYTVSIKNEDPAVFPGPQDLIATVDSTICSLLVSKAQADIPPAPGYIIMLADIMNRTNVFAESEPFEIKPKNSPYPTTTAGLDKPPTSATGGDNGGTPTNAPGDGNSEGNEEGAGVALSARSGLFAVAAAALGFMIAA